MQEGFRINGNILSKDTSFNKELTKLLNPPKYKCDKDPCECKFSSVDQRRKNFIAYLEREGIPYKAITAHSWRKGSASNAASGSTHAPSIIAICLRAGWKLPGSLNRYLCLEQAGDQFVGRVVAGLPIMDKAFCVLPPRFKKNLSAEDKAFIDNMYELTYPNDNLWGSHMIPICRHLFANLCFHKDFLMALPQTHQWHMTYLARHPTEFARVNALVEIKYDGDGPDCQ